MSRDQRFLQRRRVTQEAAELLYTGQETEYRQAKLRAARTFGAHFLPNNAEIALELDQIAEAREGKARKERLVEMRREALRVMRILEDFKPVLVGSVWRGTANRNSDIDIIAYAHDPKDVVLALQRSNFALNRTETRTVTKNGRKRSAFHIYVDTAQDRQAEVIVRDPESIGHKTKCEIYGDNITGLTIQQLQQVLKQNPLEKFVKARLLGRVGELQV